jgi:protein-S-isoprenylcysteine O-methyltransferase Ste14
MAYHQHDKLGSKGLLSDVILPRPPLLESRLWDVATRLLSGGCMAFLAAGVYVGLRTSARSIDFVTFDLAFVAQFFAGCFLFLLLIAQSTLILARPAAVKKAAGLQPRVTALLGTWLVGLAIVLPLRDNLPASVSLLAAGLGALGDACALCVAIHLGRSFSIMAEAREVVAHGPYHFVRHPLYLAEELGLLNAVLLHWSLWAALIFAGQILCQFQRIRNEERILSATFPDYVRYCERVPMLVPRALSRSWR